MRANFDVVIVGAGPAGSTAAILLARAGWSVVLIEKQKFPRRKVCGECIAATNLPLLEALGVGNRFEASAGPQLRRVSFMQGRDSIISDLPAVDHFKHKWGRALGRETLDVLLIEQARAAGAVILQPWSVRLLDGTAGDFSCTVRSVGSHETSVLRAPVVVDAHGSWERSWRSSGDRARKLHASDLLAFKANFRGAKLDAGLLPVISFKGGYGGMVVADQAILTIACCIRADRLAALRREAPGVPAGVVVGSMLQRECSGVASVLKDTQRQGAWLSAGPLNPGIHFKSNDQVLRIGNAAAESHPIIGEGISMAIQSAWLLCEHLIGAGALEGPSLGATTQQEVRDSYAADWRRAFARRLRLAAVFAHIAMRPFPFSRPLGLARHFAPLLKYAAELSGKASSIVDPAQVTLLAEGGTRNRQWGSLGLNASKEESSTDEYV